VKDNDHGAEMWTSNNAVITNNNDTHVWDNRFNGLTEECGQLTELCCQCRSAGPTMDLFMDQHTESLIWCTTLTTAARRCPASSSSSWHIDCCGPLWWLPSPRHDIASSCCVVINHGRSRSLIAPGVTDCALLSDGILPPSLEAMSLLQVTALL